MTEIDPQEKVIERADDPDGTAHFRARWPDGVVSRTLTFTPKRLDELPNIAENMEAYLLPIMIRPVENGAFRHNR